MDEIEKQIDEIFIHLADHQAQIEESQRFTEKIKVDIDGIDECISEQGNSIGMNEKRLARFDREIFDIGEKILKVSKEIKSHSNKIDLTIKTAEENARQLSLQLSATQDHEKSIQETHDIAKENKDNIASVHYDLKNKYYGHFIRLREKDQIIATKASYLVFDPFSMGHKGVKLKEQKDDYDDDNTIIVLPKGRTYVIRSFFYIKEKTDSRTTYLLQSLVDRRTGERISGGFCGNCLEVFIELSDDDDDDLELSLQLKTNDGSIIFEGSTDYDGGLFISEL